MKRRRALLDAAANAGLPDLETLALVYDGVGDYGYAINGAQGVGDTWSLVLKVNGRHPTYPKYFGHIYDGSGAGHIIDGIYASGDAVSIAGATTDGTYNGNYFFDSVGGSDRTGVQVITVVHRNVPTRRLDWYITRGGVTLATGGANLAAGGEARAPLHVAVAAAVSPLHAGVATTYAPSHLIAATLINGVATEAEARAYSLVRNAKRVWPSPLGYWPQALIAAGSVADQGTGNRPMTIVGPTAADLEAL